MTGSVPGGGGVGGQCQGVSIGGHCLGVPDVGHRRKVYNQGGGSVPVGQYRCQCQGVSIGVTAWGSLTWVIAGGYITKGGGSASGSVPVSVPGG